MKKNSERNSLANYLLIAAFPIAAVMPPTCITLMFDPLALLKPIASYRFRKEFNKKVFQYGDFNNDARITHEERNHLFAQFLRDNDFKQGIQGNISSYYGEVHDSQGNRVPLGTLASLISEYKVK